MDIKLVIKYFIHNIAIPVWTFLYPHSPSNSWEQIPVPDVSLYLIIGLDPRPPEPHGDKQVTVSPETMSYITSMVRPNHQ